MKIVFWQPMPSHHQSGAIRYLAQRWDDEVYGIYDVPMLEERKHLHWHEPDMGSVSTVFLAEKRNPEAFVQDFFSRYADAIHVLSIRGCKSVDLAWKYLLKKGSCCLILLAEQPNYFGLKGCLRKALHRRFWKKYGSRFAAVFPIGSFGVEYYKSIGVESELIFPYIYQYDGECGPASENRSVIKDHIKFIYVGSFFKRKGIDILFKAACRLSPEGWGLDLVGGGGDLDEYVKSFTKSSKHPIRLIGKWDGNQVVSCLLDYDACIVPSRFDGWGMAVNEALSAGLGVLVSDKVGSKDLVEASGAGMVVKAGSISALANAMSCAIDYPKVVAEWKERAVAFSPCISSEKVGAYLYEVMRYVFVNNYKGKRPKPIWTAKT